VAVVAPPFYEVPPHTYGGTELVCALLAEALLDRGHDVTLVGAGTARTRARFLATFAEPWPEGTELDASIQILHAARAAELLETVDVDLVHDHTMAGPLTTPLRKAPTLATVHAAVTGPESQGDLFRALGRWTPLIAISEAQRRTAPDLNWIATVHNGIDVDSHPFRDAKEDFVLFLGRLSPHKGVGLAVGAAAAAGRKIVLAGGFSVPSEEAYFERELRPLLGPTVEWVGEVAQDKKKSLLSRAACLLFPVRWEEPFGLVLVEALACGTPVVALRAGSVPEILVDGTTGIICDDPSELPGAIAAAELLRPADCRADAHRRFGMDRMAEAYETLYRRVGSRPG
jgi:glycosyltransferase involved in cell wall biosynthesis